MTAGSYQVRPNDGSVEMLQNVDTDAAAFLLKAVLVQGHDAQGPKLVFEKCGDQYFLIQIWDGMSNTGIQLPRSKHEKESLTASDGPTNAPQIIVLAMNRELFKFRLAPCHLRENTHSGSRLSGCFLRSPHVESRISGSTQRAVPSSTHSKTANASGAPSMLSGVREGL